MPISLKDLLEREGLTEADVVFVGQPAQPHESATPQREIRLDELLRQAGTSEYAIQRSPAAVATPQQGIPLDQLLAQAGQSAPDFLSDDQISRMGGEPRGAEHAGR